MPIKIPNGLPAKETLESENIFVMPETRAQTQNIRPLRIALLNLMPTKIVTETQLLRLIGNTPLQVEVTFQGFQMFTDFFDVFGIRLKNGSEEESLDILCRMLLKVNNVCARLGEHLCSSGNKALLVGAMNLQNVTGNSHSPKL